MLLTAEKRDTLAKNFQFKGTPFDDSLMLVKNNDGPKKEPWWTSAFTFSQD